MCSTETFVNALKAKSARFEGAGGFRAWIYRIARNLVLNRARSAGRGARALVATSPIQPESSSLPGGRARRRRSSTKLIADREMQAALDRAVLRLPPALSEVFHLRASGLRYEEMADVLEIPLGTIKCEPNEPDGDATARGAEAMDCRMIQSDLVAFTFGTPIGATSESDLANAASSDEARERIDAHLLTCTDCLRAYLRFKHHVERGASLRERPSDDVKRRIREDVASVVRPRGAARVLRSLRRPIPLYQGIAVACVAAGIAVASPWIHHLVIVAARLRRRGPSRRARCRYVARDPWPRATRSTESERVPS